MTRTTPANSDTAREPVLDTIERVSEMCFGLFMALTFVGAVSVATAGDPNPARTMFAAALGCNLAWGLVDAVMYLVRTLTNRGKRITAARAVKNARDPAAGRLALAESLSAADRSLVGDAELEAIRARVAAAELPERPRLHGRDYAVPEDLYVLEEDVLLHRMRLTYEALAEGVSGAAVLREILADDI